MMTPERWQQIDELLQATLACPATERAVYLASACNGDAELRREVESLLQFHSQADDFLEAPPVEVAAEIIKSEREHSLLGRTINRYRIERQIGAGGMGVVYLARDTELNRPAALKVLLAHLTQDADRVRRFRQEARATSALNHPNILTIYDVGQIDDEHFIASEFVQGRTLRELLRTETIRLDTVLEITTQITEAIAAAHTAGIVHRDIKPENIMVRPDGLVKVLDFGLAKLSETQNAESLPPVAHPSSFILHPSTTPGLVMGTVAYMSPEQARGVEVDERSDLFSIGVVLYELVTGYQPFQGATQSDVLAALLERTPPPLTHYVSGLPASLQEFINRTLAKSKSERYKSAQELLRDLNRLKQIVAFSGHRNQVSPNAETVAWSGADMNAAPPMPTNSVDNVGKKTFSSLSFLTNYLSRQLLARRVFAGKTMLALIALLAGGMLLAQWLRSSRPPTNSIAVLPFINASNDPQLDYLPDGLTESLIDSLMKLPSLRIKARSMVVNYKGREVDPRQVRKDLQVPALVTGRVQRQGDNLLIRVELIDTEDGAQIWSHEYRTSFAGLLRVQEEIAREMTANLRLRQNDAAQTALTKPPTTNAEANRLYMEGRHHWNKRNPDNMRKSLELFRQAIALDPNYALAYVGLADSYVTLGSYHAMPPKEAIPLAREAIEQALRIDENNAEAHATMGKMFTDYYWDWPQAEKEFQRAISLKPNYENGHHWYSTFLVNQGRFEEAVSEAQRALDLDPLSPVLSTQLGNMLYRARRYEEALTVLKKTLELEPNYRTARYYIGLCYLAQGKYPAALAEFRQCYALAPTIPSFVALLSYSYALSGNQTEALRYQRELDALAQQRFVSPLMHLWVHLGLNEKDEVFKWLEKCFEDRDPTVGALKTEPMLDVVRSDARFDVLLHRAGFSPK